MRRIGRYVLHDEIAAGGMGAVHLGRALGSAGFARIVAIKRLHPHLASAPAAVAAFTDEACLSARVHHPNVVATLDVVDHDRELLLVMDYVHGASLASLARSAKSADTKVPVAIAVAVAVDVLSGLQAIHEATSEEGKPLAIVHRDISPQNILVGADGLARVVDFGIAKAAVRLQNTTGDGSIKGKLRYMAPEQLLNQDVDPRTDAFSASVVLWELLTGESLFAASNDGAVIARVLEGVLIPPSRYSPGLPPELDTVVLRGLSRRPEGRFASCREMVSALRAAVAPAPADEVSRWVQALAGDLLRERAARVSQIEMGLATDVQPPLNAAESPTVTAPHAGTSEVALGPRRKRGLVAFGVVGLLAATVVAVGLAAPWRQAPAPSSSVEPPLVASSAPAVAVAVATSADVEKGALASASARALPPEPSSAPHGVPVAPRSAPPRIAPTRTSAHPGCNPMFTVDENGIRRVKPECL